MSKKDVKGVRGVLGGMLSEDDASRPTTVSEAEQPAESTSPAPSETTPNLPERPKVTQQSAKATKAEPGPIEVAAARRGRPPGRKAEKGKSPKTKATVYLPQDLLNEYIDWSWDERCTLSDLVERAMGDYKKRKRSAQPVPIEPKA